MIDKQLTILLVDDEPEILDLFESVLDNSVYDIFTCTSASAAIEILQNTSIDIIVSDFKMPGELNGIDILYHINEKQLKTKFILQTAFATVELAIKAMKSGAFDLILKPVNILHFSAIVEKCGKLIITERENTQLRSDNERLNEINKLKEKFITITNHELRTPLTILKGYTDLLECYTEDLESEEIKQSVETIQTTLNDFEYIIKRMHAATQLNTSKYKYEPKEMNLCDLIQDQIQQFHVIANDRKINIVYTTTDESVSLINDPNLIRKAIREVIQNAIRFTPDNGEISFSIMLNSTTCVLEIKDTGIGIPHSSIDHIFDMFYEAQDVMHHSTSQSNFMGSSLGIGLYLVKEISEICKFQIIVKSDEDKGTTVKFIFPR